MNNILVSIIVPIYNVEAYVYKCVSSLINQTLKDIEIICINDHSQDYSLNIIEKLAGKDERIKIINNEKNIGVAKSRNLGLAVAEGEYVGFVDADDSVDLDYYEKLYKKAKEKDSDVVKGLCKMVYPDGTSREHWYNKTALHAKKKNKFIPTSYNHGFWLSIYKKKFLDKHEMSFCNLTNGEDIVFLLKTLCYAVKFDVINNSHYYYYQRQNSATFVYKEENVTSVLNHFIYQVEFLNNIEIKKEDYIEYFSKQIMPAYERWFLIFKRHKFDQCVYENYINGLFHIYELAKYKKVFKNREYYNALKNKNAEEYMRIFSAKRLKVF